jgi:beta-lactamase superfamily II metal-dependent hydrolase
MTPLVAYAFNNVTGSGLLLNPPVIALAGWILPVGIVMLFLSCGLALASGAGVAGVFDVAFELGARAVSVMTDLMLKLTETADAIPYGHTQVESPPAALLFAFYGLLFFGLSETNRILFARRRFRAVLSICAGVVLAVALCFLSPVCRQDDSALVFVDVGQGDCLHVRTPDGRNYLVDGGGSVDYDIGKNTLLPYLLKNGVTRLDGVFATHLHSDHWRGLCGLSREMDMGRIFIYEGNRVRIDEIRVGNDAERDDGMRVDAPAEDIEYVAMGDVVTLGEDVTLNVLWPPRHEDAEYVRLTAEDADENKSSLIMRLDYEGVGVLMTGDAGEEAERSLMAAYRADAGGAPGGEASATGTGSEYLPVMRADILKVGHHGSRTSTSDSFLAAVRPVAAVIQVGRNTFGHPTRDALEKLRADDIMVFRNDLGGAVMLRIRDGRVIRAEDCATRF